LSVVLLALTLSACSASSGGSQSKTESMSVAVKSDNGAANEARPAAEAQQQTSKETGSGTTGGVKQSGENGFNRKLIYTGSMSLQVKDYEASQKQLRELVAGAGAYILNFSESSSKSEIGGTFTIKVEAGGFISLLDGIETISKAKQRNVQGQDVTEEYVDLTARLKAKETVEERLLAFMTKAEKSEDLLAFSKELGAVQEEIERIKGRMRYLDQNVAYSTIEVRLVQPLDTVVKSLEEDESLRTRMLETIVRSFNVLVKLLENVLIIVIAILPFLVPIALIAWLVIWWLRRHNKASKPMPASPTASDIPVSTDEPAAPSDDSSSSKQ